MPDLDYDKVIKILKNARRADRKCEMFGASAHQYKLNPPIEEAVVRAAEEKYGIKFPDDYVRFITKAGNGGAGPDYGIMSLEESLMYSGEYDGGYKFGLNIPFTVHPMAADEVGDYAFSEEAYKRDPNKFFVCDEFDYDLCRTGGYFAIGTHGSQWDFGLVVCGERQGQVFDTDNEGAYAFVAGSFNEFYQDWLDKMNTKNIKNELKMRKERIRKVRKKLKAQKTVK